MTRVRARPASVRAALAVALALFVGAARADEPPGDAEALIQHGIELRRAGKNGEALSEFQKAYAIAPTPRAQAQIALALHALGDWLGAERGLDAIGGGLTPICDPLARRLGLKL